MGNGTLEFFFKLQHFALSVLLLKTEFMNSTLILSKILLEECLL